MNVADSLQVASTLESLGFSPSDQAEDADVVILNTFLMFVSILLKRLRFSANIHPMILFHKNLSECGQIIP